MVKVIRTAEMFAGVGGFRLGLEGHPGYGVEPSGPFETVWANQWEPPGTPARQYAWRCYEARFGEGSCVNEDVTALLDSCEDNPAAIPDFDLLTAGFPCQDYSVARTADQAAGITGKKGVLWWEVYRLARLKLPTYLLLENVDRLLKSPTNQRGRDFAIILASLSSLGYSTEWKVVNAADYGMPQRRRRVFVAAKRARGGSEGLDIISRALPAEEHGERREFDIDPDIASTSEAFGCGLRKSPFLGAGRMSNGHVETFEVSPSYSGVARTVRDVLVPDSEVPPEYFIGEDQMRRWEYLKGSKKEPRRAANGHEYTYSEGPVAFPDDLDKPARTILTSEGGRGASRMKHVVRGTSGRLRRLVPDELDALQTFPMGWTDTGMTDSQRAFCIGNALVVEVVHAIGKAIAEDWRAISRAAQAL